MDQFSDLYVKFFYQKSLNFSLLKAARNFFLHNKKSSEKSPDYYIGRFENLAIKGISGCRCLLQCRQSNAPAWSAKPPAPA